MTTRPKDPDSIARRRERRAARLMVQAMKGMTLFQCSRVLAYAYAGCILAIRANGNMPAGAEDEHERMFLAMAQQAAGLSS